MQQSHQPNEQHGTEAEKPAVVRPAKNRWWHSVKAVAWAILGVRKGSGFEEDFARLTPLHVVAVGLVAIFAMVLGLIVVVNWIV